MSLPRDAYEFFLTDDRDGIEDHGFETAAIPKEHYMIDDEFVAEVMMAKRL